MHALTNPLIFTLYSCLVDGQETGRVFALDSILQQVASFLKTAVLQTIYTHTLNWYQGFIWIILSVMAIISAIIMTGIHVVLHKSNPDIAI
uniref:ABC transmembrane type-1 domain-containing protein n=2 Tax=Bursaphelenchus xylophilus TaxID=6326 RepID=A0A1I7SHD2_BURXY